MFKRISVTSFRFQTQWTHSTKASHQFRTGKTQIHETKADEISVLINNVLKNTKYHMLMLIVLDLTCKSEVYFWTQIDQKGPTIDLSPDFIS